MGNGTEGVTEGDGRRDQDVAVDELHFFVLGLNES